MSDVKKVGVIMIGNPGSGKSTLENLLVGKAVFPVGKGRAGSGCTQEVLYHPPKTSPEWSNAPWVVVDSPGLGDLTTSEAASKSLTAALKDLGAYKILFVLRADGNRVQQDDIVRAITVIDSCGGQIGGQYGIIINKIDEDSMEDFEKDPQLKAQFLSNIQNALPPDGKTMNIYFNVENEILRKVKDLDGLRTKMENNEVSLPLTLQSFILNIPSVILDQDKVTPIVTDKEKIATMKTDYEKTIAENLKAFEQMTATYDAKLHGAKEDFDRQNEEHRKRLDDVQRAHAEQMAAMQKEAPDGNPFTAFFKGLGTGLGAIFAPVAAPFQAIASLGSGEPPFMFPKLG